MMIDKHGLKVDAALHAFLVEEALPGSGVDEATFFAGLADLVTDFAPRNHELLAQRDALQAKIDAWHRDNRARPIDQAAYERFLRDIGYLKPQPAPQTITTANVDDEIAVVAGPQLVVPISNARYALNAANARWGSLYDALYGTDAVPRIVVPVARAGTIRSEAPGSSPRRRPSSTCWRR
jgi:Malate synthase